MILLGNMLFPEHATSHFNCQPVFMAEDQGLCTQYRYHKHKLILYLAAMRHYRDWLRQQGIQVEYHELTSGDQVSSYEAKLATAVQKFRVRRLETYTIENHQFCDRITQFCQQHQLELVVHDSPMFLTTQAQFVAYRQQYQRLFMADFYKLQRQRLQLLLEPDGQPMGGKWSLDASNRQSLPKGLAVPPLSLPQPTAHVQAVSQLVDTLFSDHPGDTQGFWLPVTRPAALTWLETFVQERLEHFGPYEDALPTQEPFVFHSVLSPLMNLGLLLPLEVVNAALCQAAEHNVPLQSLEGFVRQIIGWREYIRGVYHLLGQQQSQSNYFQHQRQLTDAWYSGTTGLLPLDLTIQRVRERGWAHHIERLMVLSSAMLLAEIHPDAVYRWFMEMFVDSADWVMVPNIYGMGQFADGGLIMTKPYCSGSNYLRKMGDFPQGAWCDVWDGLYWRFVDRQRSHLSHNPRTQMMVRTFDRMKPERRALVLGQADQFIQTMTQ